MSQLPLKEIKNYSKLEGIMQQQFQKVLKFLNSENIIVRSILGQGSFGLVISVKNEIMNHSCAVKIQLLIIDSCNGNILYPNDPEFQQKVEQKQKILENEAKIMKSINHINIVKIFNSFIKDDLFYIFMEECQMNLDQYYKENKDKLKEKEIFKIWDQLISGMEKLHQQKIFLRDIKLENILINDLGIIKYCDFGLSKQIENTNLLSSSVFKIQGNIFSHPPEIFSILMNQDIVDKESYFRVNKIWQDEYSDVWGLGIVMIQLAGAPSLDIVNFNLTGQQVYGVNVSQEANKFIMNTLKREKNLRPNIHQVRQMYTTSISKGLDSQLQQSNQNLNLKLYPYLVFQIDESNQIKQFVKIIQSQSHILIEENEVYKLWHRSDDLYAEKIKAYNKNKNIQISLILKKIDQNFDLDKLEIYLKISFNSIKFIQIYSVMVFKVQNQEYCLLEMEQEYQSLEQFIKKCKKSNSLSQDLKLNIAQQLISSLYELHINEQIHGDLNLWTIFVNDINQNIIQIKLDLQTLSIEEKLDSLQRDRIFIAQFFDDPNFNGYSKKSDMWGLGLILLYIDNIEQFSDNNLFFRELFSKLHSNYFIYHQKNSKLTKIATQCLKQNKDKRPSIQEIMEQINDE